MTEKYPKYCLVFSLPADGAMTGADFFDVMSAVLLGFEELNHALLTGISSEIKVLSYIEDIESGSIKIWLRDNLERLSDDHIRDLTGSVPTLPFWLIGARKLIIKIINDKGGDEEKSRKIENGVTGLLDNLDQTQKEKWDKNSTLRAVKKIARASQKLDKVAYIDNDNGNGNGELKIEGTFDDAENTESTQTEELINVTIELLSMHQITGRQIQKKWRFRYEAQPIDVDISECADFLSNEKFKARGCFMKVVLLVKQSEINKNGMRSHKNDYILKEVLEIEQ